MIALALQWYLNDGMQAVARQQLAEFVRGGFDGEWFDGYGSDADFRFERLDRHDLISYAECHLRKRKMHSKR